MADDPGDVVRQKADSNQFESGPGGVTRDRAIDLARQGLPVEQAIAQATAETHTGHNPRDPHGSGADKPGGSPDQTAGNTQNQGQQTSDGTTLSGWLSEQTLIPGVPNWAVAGGGGLLTLRVLR